MRAIEKKMLSAIRAKQSWQESNTTVHYADCNSDYGPRSEVYLFGNHIGDYWHWEQKFDVNLHTLLKWPSATTKSRLRALGVNLIVKKGKILIDNEVVGNMLKYDYLDGEFKNKEILK